MSADTTVTIGLLVDGTEVDTDEFTVTPIVTLRISNKLTTLAENATHDFNTTGDAAGGDVDWTVSGGGSITSAGVYTPPDVERNTAITVVLRVDRRTVDTDTFTVTPVVTLRISNKIGTLDEDDTHNFNTTGSDAGGVVTWAVKSGGGSITGAGVYTPADVSRDTDVVIALRVDGTEVDTDEFTVTPVASGTIANKITTLSEDATHDFNATGVPSGGVVTWSVKSGGGTISAAGLYDPPDVSADTTVTIALLVDGTEVDTDAFTVTAYVPPAVRTYRYRCPSYTYTEVDIYVGGDRDGERTSRRVTIATLRTVEYSFEPPPPATVQEDFPLVITKTWRWSAQISRYLTSSSDTSTTTQSLTCRLI